MGILSGSDIGHYATDDIELNHGMHHITSSYVLHLTNEGHV